MPIPAIVLAVVFLILMFIMNRTKSGRHIYAVGGNSHASRLAGINVNKVKIMVYVISGLLSALSGIIIAARLNSAQPDAGNGYEMDAIAAAVIGGCSMSSGGIGTMGGVILGSFIIGVLNNALNLLDVSPILADKCKGICYSHCYYHRQNDNPCKKSIIHAFKKIKGGNIMKKRLSALLMVIAMLFNNGSMWF